MESWTNDHELFQMMRKLLYTPVVGDILDTMGCYHQFLPPEIRPIVAAGKLIGRAMPVLMMDVYGKQRKPFGLLTEALDQLNENEIYLASGGSMRCAYWGELLTATARKQKAAGAIIDGFHRDTTQVMEQNWPVFSRGSYAQDSSVRTRVADFRCSIEIGGVWIEPGDLLFGDIDGIVVVPRRLESEVIEQALRKAQGEKVVRNAIEHGMTATDAFRTYGIL